jgi:hypothetical protein
MDAGGLGIGITEQGIYISILFVGVSEDDPPIQQFMEYRSSVFKILYTRLQQTLG